MRETVWLLQIWDSFLADKMNSFYLELLSFPPHVLPITSG